MPSRRTSTPTSFPAPRRWPNAAAPRSSADYAFGLRQVDDGEVLELGQVSLEVLHSPGHTPEHISLLLRDSQQGEAPFALFTGDTLFNLDVGRPDLLGEDSTKQLAAQLYATLFTRYLPLGERIEIYPCHGAGSACGKSIGDRRHSTLGKWPIAFSTGQRHRYCRIRLRRYPPYAPSITRCAGWKTASGLSHTSVFDLQFGAARFGLAGQRPALTHLAFAQHLVAAHAHAALHHPALAGGADTRAARARRLQASLFHGLQQHLAARHVQLVTATVERDPQAAAAPARCGRRRCGGKAFQMDTRRIHTPLAQRGTRGIHERLRPADEGVGG
ncbi:beta-lactamase [Pseudomonas aeruginosa PADK2_CF510]|nr:beta-lactamase [Pseudomonas aeruginosa PADK2_CF510]